MLAVDQEADLYAAAEGEVAGLAEELQEAGKVLAIEDEEAPEERPGEAVLVLEEG